MMMLPRWGCHQWCLPFRYIHFAPTGLDTSFFLVYDVVAPMGLGYDVVATMGLVLR
jgi:hypothetical protein